MNEKYARRNPLAISGALIYFDTKIPNQIPNLNLVHHFSKQILSAKAFTIACIGSLQIIFKAKL